MKRKSKNNMFKITVCIFILAAGAAGLSLGPQTTFEKNKSNSTNVTRNLTKQENGLSNNGNRPANNGDTGTPIPPEKQEDAKKSLEEAKKAVEELKTAADKIEQKIKDDIKEAEKEKDTKKQAILQEELEKLLKIKEKIQAATKVVQDALDAITTLTKEGLKTALETADNVKKIVKEFANALPDFLKIIKEILEAALKIAQTLLEGAFKLAETIVEGILDILTFPFKKIFGWLGLCCATDLNSDGMHHLAMTGEGYMALTLPSLSRDSQNVPFEAIDFNVLSEPSIVPYLHRLTVIPGTFTATLSSFTINGKIIGTSTLSVDPNISWTGIYDSRDQTLHLSVGGTIVNDYTPVSSPMAFSLAAGGPIANMSFTGCSTEPLALHQATLQQPEDMAVNIYINPTLTWRPGKWASTTQSHQVWFSTSYGAVNNRSGSANKGRFDVCEFSPGTLLFDKRYYWRVDEYNEVNTIPPPIPRDTNTWAWGGPVWQFVTIGPKAFYPQPVSPSIADFRSDSLKLSWTAGVWAADNHGHGIYFGTDYNEVNNAGTSTAKIYRGHQTDSSYNLKDLVPDYTLENWRTYYWRVDEVNDPYTWKGDVWIFIMDEYVIVDDFSYSNQADMSTVWRTSLKESGCLPDCETTPGGIATLSSGTMRLAYDNTGSYYCPWSEAKMDNNGAGLNMDWTVGGLVNTQSLSIGIDGNIFSGINPDYDTLYVAVEDSSANFAIVYCNDPIIQKRQFSGPSSNQFDISFADLMDGTPGPVDLNDVNALYIGFGPRCSWGPPPYTYGGTGVISIDNIRLYVPRCFAEYEGYKSTQAGDFAGTYNYTGNWTQGDCDVDFYDLDYLAHDWLKADVDLNYPGVVAPLNDSGHLMVRYEFDETSGDFAYDYSGNGRDATVGNPNPLLWDSSAISGTGCINLEAGFRTWLEIPTSGYSPDTNGVSFCFWSAYDANYQPMDYYAAKWSSVFIMHEKVPTEANANNNNDDSPWIESQTPTPWPPAYSSGPLARFADLRTNGKAAITSRMRLSDFSRRWNHYALIYDDVNDSMRVYLNGKLLANDTNVTNPLWPAAGSFRIGTCSNRNYNPDIGAMGPNWGFWSGKLDDFRVYNYALTEKEIQYLATKGTGTSTLRLSETTNLKTTGSPQRINFADYAIFVQQWLKQDFWP